MAYQFTAASSRHLSTASAPATTFPVTLACWFQLTNTGNNTALVVLQDADTQSRLQITNNGSTSPKRALQATYFDSAGFFGRIGINESAYSTNTWYHAAGVFASTSDIDAYFNGSAGFQDIQSPRTLSGIDQMLIGARRAASLGQYHDGLIAEVGIWNVALTQPEIASLAAGYTCDKVRPQSLVFYAPLCRDLIDVKGGLTITNNNSATVANHPRVYA